MPSWPARIDPDTWIEVGTLGRPRGLGGLVWFRGYSAESAAVHEGVTVRVVRADGTTSEHVLGSVSEGSHGLALGLRGVVGREAAEALLKATVSVRRRDFPELEEGEFYHSDVIGAAVLDAEGAAVGEVVRIEPYPSVDALVVRLVAGTEVELPIVDHVVLELDVDAGRVTVDRAYLEAL